MIKTADIPRWTNNDGWTDRVDLAQGYSVRVRVENDDDIGPPWEWSDGHGPVSDWRQRDSKAPGERILCADHGSCRFYDFAAAVKLARKDGWDAPPYKTGTPGEQAVRAVERDFGFLRAWCAGEWNYISVGVEVSRNGAEVETDYCGGIESCGDYWREHAAESARGIIAHDIKARKAAAVAARKETIERRHWAARDVVTI